MSCRVPCAWLPAGGLLAAAISAWAGGGPLRTAVVVNDASPESQALGQYYQEQRGLPEAHLLHVWTTPADAISLSAYTNEILHPVMNALATRGLTGQVDTLVFTRGMPYRVTQGASVNGITAVALYGFHSYPSSPVCTLPAGTDHAYFGAEEAFSARDRRPDGIGFLSIMLTADSLEAAMQVVDRSIAADATQPAGTVYFLHTSDTARNVQWPQFEDAATTLRLLQGPDAAWIGDGNQISNQPAVIGQVIGLARPGGIAGNTYLPGALADHLTSYGGVLYDSSQMSILEWLKAGCAGSYGTVVEPCNYTNKFPHARLHAYYARGFAMGEAYTMAVRNPYMGIWVGDPLCAPYALPPSVELDGLIAGETREGLVTLAVTGRAAPGRVVRRLDLHVDGLLLATLTNAAPAAGETVTLTIGTTDRHYIVQDGDDIDDIARGLAAAVNRMPPLPIDAEAHSDRVTLRQAEAGAAWAGLTYAVSSSGATVHPATAGSVLEESPYAAYQLLTLSGTPETNDQVTLVVTRLDGIAITNQVTFQDGDLAGDLLQRLADAVNADPDLQGADGIELKYLAVNAAGTEAEVVAVARSTGWETYNLQLEYAIDAADLTGPAYAGPLASNRDTMVAQGIVWIACGASNLSASAVLDTTNLADGPHLLQIVAADGSAVQAEGLHTVAFTVDNHDLDCILTAPDPAYAWIEGQTVVMQAAAGGGAGSVTSLVFRVEGIPVAEVPDAAGAFAVDTVAYGAGQVTLQAEARTDAGECTRSEPVTLRILSAADADGDQLPDGWEVLRFGSITNTTGATDTDGDGQNDHAEFAADTNPLDPASRFSLTAADPGPATDQLVVAFVSSPARTYQVEVATGLTTGPWAIEPAPAFPGNPGTTRLTNAVPATGFTAFRIRAFTP